MRPKKSARNERPATRVVKKAAKRSDIAEDIDLNDDESFQVNAVHPELVDELDAKLLPYLKDTITDFLRHKVPKRKRDPEDDVPAKRTKKARQIEYEDNWQVQNHLGSGAFGNVGLWVKKNSDGEIEDELAIKEAKYNDEYVWSNISGLSREAVMTNHVNKTKVENFVQLRSFKCFIGGLRNRDKTVPAKSTTWIYYLEYAPHGDLLRLIDRYRAWNQYLPEVFLWHVFDSLAKAILAMAEHEVDVDDLPAQAGDEMQTIKSTSRLIHFDIKPENIFCGRVPDSKEDTDKRGGLKTSSYPTLKLADFGVAEFDNGRDENNPERYAGTGTQYYMPPEQKLYGVLWRNPPNHEAGVYAQKESGDFKDNDDVLEELCEREKDFHFTQAMNVWNIGKTMYDLTSLSRKWSYARLSTLNEHEYKANNSNAIANFNTLPFQSSQMVDGKILSSQSWTSRPPYSTQLTDLIRDCMKPEVADRVTAQDLYTRTQAGIANHDDGVPDNLPKVFYEQNEINKMPLGNDNFPTYDGGVEGEQREESDVQTLLGAKFDPDWEKLQLPPKKWKDRVTKWEIDKAKIKANAKGKEPAFEIVNGRILFGSKNGRRNKTTTSTTKAAAPTRPANASQRKEQVAATKASAADGAQDQNKDDGGTPLVKKAAGIKVKTVPAAPAVKEKAQSAKDATVNAKGKDKADAKQDKKGKAAPEPKLAKKTAQQDESEDELSDEELPPPKKIQANKGKGKGAVVAPKSTKNITEQDEVDNSSSAEEPSSAPPTKKARAKPGNKAQPKPSKVVKPAAEKAVAAAKPAAKDKKKDAKAQPAKDAKKPSASIAKQTSKNTKKQAANKAAAATESGGEADGNNDDDNDDELDESAPPKRQLRSKTVAPKVAPKPKADKSKAVVGKQQKAKK